MNLKSKILAATAVLALTMTGVTGAQAAQTEKPSRKTLEPVSLSERLNTNPPLVVAPAEEKVELAYVELPPVTPKPVELIPVQQPAVAQTPTPQPVATPQTQTYVQPSPVATAAVIAPPAPPSSGVGAALVASAYGQLGAPQDCTAMVENALRSIGKSVGDLAPSQFFAYGAVVGSPEPGDLVITGGHVAIYVGNGNVISGGFDGMNTVEHPLSYLAGASFVRVT